MRPVSFAELKGISKLFLDYIQFAEPANRFFIHDFKEDLSYFKVADEIDKADFKRKTLSDILKDGTSSVELSPKTRENIEKLAHNDSLAVFAGQQPGMLLGPVYTAYKALTAFLLAKRLEEKLNRPVVPCFWMVSDDHDFEEVRSAYFLNREGDCLDVAYEPDDYPSGIPFANIILTEELNRFWAKLEENLISTEFSEDIMGILKRSYLPGRSFPAAFLELFEIFFKDFGIVPIDPNFPKLKELFLPIFEKEIENHREIFGLYERCSSEIEKAGYQRQVHKTVRQLNLFFNAGIRRNLILSDNRYGIDGLSERYSKDALLKMLNDSPGRFSPNVLLRPIVQCAVFPTVCQVVGPSEAAYFAQLKPVFDYFEVVWPVARPRIFATLMEPHIKKIMDDLFIDFVSLYNDQNHELTRILENRYSGEIEKKAQNTRLDIEKLLGRLMESLNDPQSRQAVEHSRRIIDKQMNDLSERLFKAYKKRQKIVQEKTHRTASFLFPKSNFQERLLSPVYFANKFGIGWLKKIADKFDIDSFEHQLIEIDG